MTTKRTSRKRMLLSDEEAAMVARMRAGGNGQAPPPDDPHGRLDILGIRFIERLMDGCKDPALHGYYARYKPAIDSLMKEYLGPIQIPASLGKRVSNVAR